MSADDVDDLHNAEDLIVRLANALRDRGGAGGPLSAADDYCRPTCGAEGGPHEDPELDEFCGCLCHQRPQPQDPPCPCSVCVSEVAPQTRPSQDTPGLGGTPEPT